MPQCESYEKSHHIFWNSIELQPRCRTGWSAYSSSGCPGSFGWIGLEGPWQQSQFCSGNKAGDFFGYFCEFLALFFGRQRLWQLEQGDKPANPGLVTPGKKFSSLLRQSKMIIWMSFKIKIHWNFFFFAILTFPPPPADLLDSEEDFLAGRIANKRWEHSFSHHWNTHCNRGFQNCQQ